MKKGITRLLPENVALDNVKYLVVCDADGNEVCRVDAGRMRMGDLGKKLYSFGLLSDIHMSVWSGDAENVDTYETVMAALYQQKCDFVCICGDLTNTGFHLYEDDDTVDTVNWYDDTQFSDFKRINDLYPAMPVYACCGNHESYVKSITENLAELEAFTGHGLAYAVERGGDLFVFVSQTDEGTPMSYEHFLWLGATLEANKGKRCFVFIHPFVDESDSGDPLGLHSLPLFNDLTVSQHEYDKSTFVELMAGYPNAILFHGHSHMMLENQQVVANANYSTALGFKSVHVPSTAYCRDVRSGAIEKVEVAQGYVVDVYESHIVLRGMVLSGDALDSVALGTYKINTTLKPVAPGTFSDETGLIETMIS